MKLNRRNKKADEISLYDLPEEYLKFEFPELYKEIERERNKKLVYLIL